MKYRVFPFIAIRVTFVQPETIAKAMREESQTPIGINASHGGKGKPPLLMESDYQRPRQRQYKMRAVV